MPRKGAGTTLAMAPHASSPALRPGSHTIPRADGCRPLLFSPSVIKPGFGSVKLDIIAQNRCLGDNFNALQQALRGSKVFRRRENRAFNLALLPPAPSTMNAPPTAPTRAAPAGRPGVDTALLANAIRALAMDAVQAANSGHPGMPMGMAEVAVALWDRHLRHNPANPHWADRDRFVLSNGHGSMLQYALLHLTGYALPIEELKRFRQLHSKTPGHPEVGVTPGVETTTGPLGQGLANAVGMALAEKLLAAEFNRADHPIVDHRTYVVVGDGCLMEGISHEACSLAGTLRLSKLTAFYDDNGISIDGETKGWFTDDTPRRFAAYRWHVITVNGHDVDAVDAAIREAHTVEDRPTLICCKTIIGKGSPNRAGTELAHGQALGEKEVAATRKALGWTYPPFEIPQAAYDGWDARERGVRLESAWNERFAAYKAAYPESATEFERRTGGQLPDELAATATAFVARQTAKAESVATRKASQQALEALGPVLPELIGGAADEVADDLRVHARFDRAGRRRPDASGDRARFRATADSAARRVASVRHGRVGGRVAARHRTRERRNVPVVHASERSLPTARPLADRCDQPRRLRPGRLGRSRPSTRRHHRDRVGSRAGDRRARRARRRRNRGAGGVDAVHEPLRPPGSRLSRPRASARSAAGLGRGRGDRLLAQVRRPRRRGGRHRYLRRVRSGERLVQALRLYRRQRRHGGAERDLT